MATGSLTDCPWLFQKIIRPLGLQAFQALGRLPRPVTSKADSRKATQPQRPPLQDNHGMADSREPAIEDIDSPEPALKNADFPEPATKSADSKKPAKTATTKTTPT